MEVLANSGSMTEPRSIWPGPISVSGADVTSVWVPNSRQHGWSSSFDYSSYTRKSLRLSANLPTCIAPPSAISSIFPCLFLVDPA